MGTVKIEKNYKKIKSIKFEENKKCTKNTKSSHLIAYLKS